MERRAPGLGNQLTMKDHIVNIKSRPDDFQWPPSSEIGQRLGGGPDGVHRAAAHGIQGPGRAIPHVDAIQRSFGRHDIGDIQAYVGGTAREASEAMGAEAYATGNAVAFKAAPDLHTAAHEAAHVVQQRGGVQLQGGVGRVGDRYERHADAVADMVVQGKSAEGLLDRFAGAGPDAHAVQREQAESAVPAPVARPTRDGAHASHNVAMFNTLLAANSQYLALLIRILEKLGFQVTGGMIGFRASYMLSLPPVTTGGGMDWAWFFDVASWSLTGEPFPWVEGGMGMQGGVGAAVLFGLRLSPTGRYGEARDSYAGTTVNVGLAFLAGINIGVSKPLFDGKEGWITIAPGFDVGAEGSLSMSHAWAGQDITEAGQEAARKIATAAESYAKEIATQSVMWY